MDTVGNEYVWPWPTQSLPWLSKKAPVKGVLASALCAPAITATELSRTRATAATEEVTEKCLLRPMIEECPVSVTVRDSRAASVQAAAGL